MPSFDSKRLYSTLLNSGLQTKDPPLYQVIYQLIQALVGTQNTVNSGGGGSAGSATINQTNQIFQIVSGADGDGGDSFPIAGERGSTGASGGTGATGQIGGMFPVEDGVDGQDGLNIPVPGPQGIQGNRGNDGAAIFLTQDIPEPDWLPVPGERGSGSAFNLLADYVATAENQGSGLGYADLTTPGPSVTITIGSSGIAIVWIATFARRTGTGNTGFASPDVSGANTIAASDAKAGIGPSAVSTGNANLGTLLYYTGLTPGSTTFKLQYKNDGGSTWTFSNRGIAVYCP